MLAFFSLDREVLRSGSQDLERLIPRQDEQRVQQSSKDQLESLILAQNERWRQA